MKNILKLLRVTHYIKNLLIFAPLFFSGSLFNLNLVLRLIYMILPFCTVASAVYIFNDLNDLEKDKKHPTKCKRPLASGAVSVKTAYSCIILLSITTVLLFIAAYILGFAKTSALLLVILYAALNLLYSKGLKNIPIADTVILSAGYLIRIYYGAEISCVIISPWLYLTVLMVSLYFGFGKRRNEMINVNQTGTREVLNKYTIDFLDKYMYMFAGLTITFYALWSIQTEYTGMFWTVPAVLVIFMRYGIIIEGGKSEADPMSVILSDRALQILAVAYMAIVFFIIYI